jgi:nitrogen fixation protein NifU and related proteins
MADLTRIYDDVLMDHIKNARNYRVIAHADRTVEAVNVLCGDTLRLFLQLDGDRIADIAFECSCCGISMGSASMMTAEVKGKTSAEARLLYRQLVEAVQSGDTKKTALPNDAQAVVLATLRNVPARKNCAMLGWHALKTALDGYEQHVAVG